MQNRFKLDNIKTQDSHPKSHGYFPGHAPKRVVDLSKAPLPTTINELSPLVSDAEVSGIVVKTNPSRAITNSRSTGGPSSKCSLIIADACDTCGLTCWNDSTGMIKDIKVGDIVRIQRPLVRNKSDHYSLTTTSAYEMIIEGGAVGAAVAVLDGGEEASLRARFSMPPSRLKTVPNWNTMLKLHQTNLATNIDNSYVLVIAAKIMPPTSIHVAKTGSFVEKQVLLCADSNNTLMAVNFWGADCEILTTGNITEGKTSIALGNLRLQHFNNKNEFTVGYSSFVMVAPVGAESRALAIAFANATRCDSLITQYFQKEDASKLPLDTTKALPLVVSQIEGEILKEINSPSQSPATFYSYLTVSWIDLKATYNGCASCHRKAENGVSTCPACSSKPSALSEPAWEGSSAADILPLYCLRCTFLDETGGFTQVVFSEAAAQIMGGLDCVVFASKSDEEKLKVLQELCWKKFKVFYTIKQKKPSAKPTFGPKGPTVATWGIDIQSAEPISKALGW